MSKIGCYIGKFYPFHEGHGYVIKESLKSLDKLIILICWEDGQTLPLEIRRESIIDFCKENNLLDKIEIHECLDSLKIGVEYEGKSDYNLSKAWSDYLIERFPETTHFVGSEDYVKMMSVFAKTSFIQFERQFDISSRKIRGDINKSLSVKNYIPKVAVVGIESSGKSTLVKTLEQLLPNHIEIVEEYGRVYCEANTNVSSHINHEYILNGQDFMNIVLGHNRMLLSAYRKALVKGKKLILCDTEHVVTKNFLDYHEGFESEKAYIENMCKSQHYDLVIYLEPLELELDGTRLEYSEYERQLQNKILKDNILKYHKNVVFVQGDNLQLKVNKAMNEINKLIGGFTNEI